MPNLFGVVNSFGQDCSCDFLLLMDGGRENKLRVLV